MTLASYASGVEVNAYVRHLAFGETIPDMPLFLTSDQYIRVPPEAVYAEQFDHVPEPFRPFSPPQP